MEYADAGDLHQKITQQQKANEYFSEEFVWKVVVQVTLGLKVLHGMGVAHRDLKSANVFLFQDGSVKLGDFNVSKVNRDAMMQTQTGTPYYASPEVWTLRPYDHKADIWSLGCVIYETCALYPPFRAGDIESLQRRVTQGAAPQIPMVFSHDLQTLVSALLSVDPAKRPSCDMILKSPCIQRHPSSLRSNPNLMSDSMLLKTIRVPNSLHKLEDKLPKPRYVDNDSSSPSRAGSSSRFPALSTPFSNLRGSESSSPYKPDSRNQSLDSSPSRRLARREYYREALTQSRRSQESNPMRGMTGASRILESVRRSQEARESWKSRQSHPRQRIFLPGD